MSVLEVSKNDKQLGKLLNIHRAPGHLLTTLFVMGVVMLVVGLFLWFFFGLYGLMGWVMLLGHVVLTFVLMKSVLPKRFLVVYEEGILLIDGKKQHRYSWRD